MKLTSRHPEPTVSKTDFEALVAKVVTLEAALKKLTAPPTVTTIVVPNAGIFGVQPNATTGGQP